MHKFLIILTVLFLSITEVFAYAVKIYDQWGNRIGTYKKEGENYVLYDFYDKKVENPSDLIKNAPSQETLKEQVQFFYDENLIPIGSFSTGLWTSKGRYIPRGVYYPRGFYPRQTPYMVRPSANTYIYEEKYPYFNRKNSSTNIIRTTPRVHY